MALLALLGHRATGELTLLAWVSLVLLVHMAHVYGMLFQTYFDPVWRHERHALL